MKQPRPRKGQTLSGLLLVTTPSVSRPGPGVPRRTGVTGWSLWNGSRNPRVGVCVLRSDGLEDTCLCILVAPMVLSTRRSLSEGFLHRIDVGLPNSRSHPFIDLPKGPGLHKDHLGDPHYLLTPLPRDPSPSSLPPSPSRRGNEVPRELTTVSRPGTPVLPEPNLGKTVTK